MSVDLTDVPTSELVAEAQRRAPFCPPHGSMLVAPRCFRCAACGKTAEFDAVDEQP